EERQLREAQRIDFRGRVAREQGPCQVEFLFVQPLFQLRLVSLTQGQSQVGKLLAHVLRQFRQMIAQNGAGGAKAQLLSRAAAQFFGQGFEPLEKRFNEAKQFFAGAGQREGSAVEQRDAEGLFQLDDLRADRRLLNSVRDVAHRLADSAVTGDIVEQLQVMDVHESIGLADNFTKGRTGRK